MNRRRLLRTSGATLATGAVYGSAGCLSALPPLGSQQSYGHLDTPAPDEATYTQWVPAPATSGSDSRDGYYLFGADTPEASWVPRLLALRRASSICSLDYFGVGWSAYDRYIWTPFGSVLHGDFSAATVEETLSRTAYTQTGTYRDYALFERPDGRQVGVRNGTLLIVTPADERPELTRLADTGAGDHPRLRETDSAGATAIAEAGGGIRLGGGREFGSFHEDAQWGVETFRTNDDNAYQVVTLVFPSKDTVTLNELKTAYQEQTGLRAGWTAGVDSFDAELTGRVGTLSARIPQKNLVEFREFAAPVQATWGFNWEPKTRRLTLRHEAGDSVVADRLTVNIDTDQEPYELDSTQVWTETDTVSPGSQTTLELADIEGLRSVELNLRQAHDDYYWSLAHWDAPRASTSTDTT